MLVDVKLYNIMKHPDQIPLIAYETRVAWLYEGSGSITCGDGLIPSLADH